MPSKATHISAAQENQVTLDYLCERIDDHLPWVTTVAFYRAVHIVEAVLADDADGHSDSHKARNDVLKSQRKYQHIWRNFRPLYNVSCVARYLGKDPNYKGFSDYMPTAEVKSKVLNHYLSQIEQSAKRILGVSEL